MSSSYAMQQRVASRPPAPATGVRSASVRSPDLSALGSALNRAPHVQQLAAMRYGLVAPVTQRVMNVVFADAVPAALQAKMDVVLATLNRMGAAVVPAVHVNLDITNDPDHLQTNPADTILRPQAPGAAFRRIDMTIRSWYIESSSVGEIVGMIGHELGVHSLADIEMTAPERAAETAQNGVPYVANIAGANRPLAPLGGAADRRQDDHVNVAKFQVNPITDVPVAPMPRMRQYIQTMLRLGDAIDAAPVGPGGEYADAPARERALNEMFQTFLFDMGRVIATDDGTAWAVAIGAGDIAEVYNWLRDDLIATHGAGRPWLVNLVVADATRAALVGMLGGKVARALWAQRGAIAAQAGRGLLALPGLALGAAVGGVRAGLGQLGF